MLHNNGLETFAFFANFSWVNPFSILEFIRFGKGFSSFSVTIVHHSFCSITELLEFIIRSIIEHVNSFRSITERLFYEQFKLQYKEE